MLTAWQPWEEGCPCPPPSPRVSAHCPVQGPQPGEGLLCSLLQVDPRPCGSLLLGQAPRPLLQDSVSLQEAQASSCALGISRGPPPSWLVLCQLLHPLTGQRTWQEAGCQPDTSSLSTVLGGFEGGENQHWDQHLLQTRMDSESRDRVPSQPPGGLPGSRLLPAFQSLRPSI